MVCPSRVPLTTGLGGRHIYIYMYIMHMHMHMRIYIYTYTHHVYNIYTQYMYVNHNLLEVEHPCGTKWDGGGKRLARARR